MGALQRYATYLQKALVRLKSRKEKTQALQDIIHQALAGALDLRRKKAPHAHATP